MKIVLFSDLHYPEQPLADIFLLRLVQRINRYIKPDVVLVAGDLIHATARPERLADLAEHLQKIEAPLVVIPGNHDPAPEVFYQYIPRPADYLDIGNWRIVPFVDTETPNRNARRETEQIERLRKLTEEFPGEVISLQHYPLYRPETRQALYNYDNAEEIFEVPFAVSLSGHYHPGMDGMTFPPGANGRPTFCFGTPALCKSPFFYSIIELGDTNRGSAPMVDWHTETLRLSSNNLCDTHVHTNMAYCAESNWDASRLFALAEAFGVRKFAFTEHSGHLYADKDTFRSGELDRNGLEGIREINRFGAYKALLAELREYGDRFIAGTEIDVDAAGRLLIRPEDAAGLPLHLGAVHFLRETDNIAVAKEEFLRRTEALCQSDIHILAHPFRVFRKKLHIAPPPDLFRPVADMLKKYHVAAEINYHGNQPEPEFFAMCHALRVPLTIGSDTHNLYEIGEFYGGVQLLRQIGVATDELFQLD